MQMQWSYSKYRSAKSCGRQFYKKYIEKAPAENLLPEEFQKGSEFHEQVERYLLGHINEVNNVMPKVKENLEFLRRFKFEDEKQFTIDLEDISISGVIDLMSVKDKEALIVELKSFPIYRNIVAEVEEQVDFYVALLYPSGYDIITTMVITPVDVDTHSVEVEGQELALKRVLRRIRMVERMIEQENFAPTPGGHCVYCSYRRLCPVFEKLEIDINNGEEVAKKIFKLENELKELKNIAKDLVNNGISVGFSDYAYEYVYYDEVTDYDPKIIDYLRERGVDPFNIKLKNWRTVKKLFNINKNVLNDLIKNGLEELAQFVDIEVKSYFAGRKKGGQNE